jgi:hypothetical protein
MSKKKLEENIKFWISEFISRNKDYDLKEIIEFSDLSKINNRYIKSFKDYNSWCFAPDFTIIIKNKINNKYEIILINRSYESVGLRAIGEIMCFNRIINPRLSFLISAKGHSEEISLFMIDKKFNQKLLNYFNKNLIIFAFDDNSIKIKKESIIPFSSRKVLYE